MQLSEFDSSLIERRRIHNGPIPHFLIGVDEAGRGPLAGPVTACAAYIPPEARPFLSDVNDSKLLSEKKRLSLFLKMAATGVRFGFGFASHAEIDELNILQAVFRAMNGAVERLVAQLGIGDPGSPFVIVDGPHKIKGLRFEQEAVIDGDARSLSIAAAGIFAKVIRDKWMCVLDLAYPGYGFSRHKGYGTKSHMETLRTLGPSAIHRTTFAPVKRALIVK